MKILTRTAIVSAAMLAAAPAFAQNKVTWWYEAATPDQQQVIDTNIVKPFEAANPGVNLSVDYRGNELDKQLRVAMLSGSGPDIVYTPGPSYVAPMAQSGQLLALDDYAKKYSWNDRILPVFLKMGQYDGKLYALPKTYETLGLFYNKTLFDKHGWKIPTNLTELETLADAMLKKKIIPFSAGNADWRGANEWFVSIALNSIAGPDNVYKALKGEIPWSDPVFVKAIDQLASWWDKGYFGPNYFSLNSGEQVADMLATGKAGMMPTGTWQFQNVAKYFGAAKTEAAFAGFPSAEGAPVFPLGVGSTFSIAASSKVPDQAAQVINFIYSPAVYASMGTDWQGEWNLPLTDISGAKMGASVPALYTDAMTNLATSVADGKYGYTTWTFLPPASDSFVVSGIEEVWLHKTTSAQFLAELDKTFQQEKSEGKVPAIPAR